MMIFADGTLSLMARQASMPDRFGMRTSSSTTSGATDSASAVPSTPSPASPTTSMPSSLASSMVRPRRKSSWSSTTSTRMGSPESPVLARHGVIMSEPARERAATAWGEEVEGPGGPARSAGTPTGLSKPR